MYNNMEPGQEKFSFSVMPVPSFYHFYHIEINGKRLVAKVFTSEKAHLYQQELDLLNELNHPNLPKPLALDPSMLSSLRQEFKGQVIIYPSAQSNMLTYVQRLRGIPQSCLKFYLKQIISALSHVYDKKALTHQNLNLQNILIEQTKNCLVGGWLNSKNIKHQLFFSLAEISLRMFLGHGVFVRKQLKFDQLGKFLTHDKIHKFWEILTNSHKRTNKNFAFSESFKSVISALFLNQLSSLDKFSQMFLKHEVPQLEQVQTQLHQKQEEIIQAKKKRLEKEQNIQKKELKIVAENHEDEQGCLQKEATRCSQPFYENYSALKDVFVAIPPIANHNLKGDQYPLFDSDPKVILAHIRTQLQQCYKNQEEQFFMHPLLTLKKDPCYASLDASDIKISLPVSWSSEPNEYTHIELTLSLSRQKQTLLGSVTQTENPDLSDDCLQWTINWLKQTLQLQQF